MFFFDPLFLILTVPAMLLAMFAQWRVQSSINEYSQVFTGRGATGAAVARAILSAYGLHEVRVERTEGFLSDHYDPTTRTLRLSPGIYDTPSVAAAGIAAHEAGHALQHAQGYWPLQARSAIVPVVQIGSFLGPLIFLVGFGLLAFGASFGVNVAWLGVILFAGTTVFTLITLPVEFDASARAKEILQTAGFVGTHEMVGVHKVLDAAALTYVAAAAQSIGTLLYYVLMLTGLQRSNE